MSSDRQVEANRRNARRSIGPRTAEGKARVASNALKHGLTGKQVVLPGEDPAEFDAFRLDLVAELDPHGALEGFLVEKIVVDAWRLRRVWQLEAALYSREDRQEKLQAAREDIDRCMTKPMESLLRWGPEPEVKPEARKAHEAAQVRLRQLQAEPVAPLARLTQVQERWRETFSNLERYETALSRSFYKALHELQRLKAIRAGERVPAPAVVDVDVNIRQDDKMSPQPIVQNRSASAESVSARVEPNAMSLEDNRAQVSFFITNSQKAELRGRGYSDDDIAKMRPAEAHKILGLT